MLNGSGDGRGERGEGFGWNDEAAGGAGEASVHHVGYLSLGIGGGDHGAAAREHACEPRGHHEVGGAGALRKQVDIGGVQEATWA